ncbi:MAG TPA: periplasmic heavy metal sensor [Prolixibacteraceae bacterium]
MRTKIFMVGLLAGLSASLMAQTTEVTPKKQGAKDQVEMSKEKGDAYQAQRSAAMGLNLNEEQKKAFKQNMLALHKQILPIKNELGEAEAHQKTLMTAEKTDLGAINKNIEKIGALRVEMAKIMAKHRVEMRAQLTDEQRLKFDLMKGKMMQAKGKHGMKPGKEMRGMIQGKMMRRIRQGQEQQGMGHQGMGPGMM